MSDANPDVPPQLPHDDRFQRVMRLAARVAGVQDARVLLVEAGALQTPRGHALAQEVLRAGQLLMEISPSFYVGVPLQSAEGQVVGVLSLRDDSAHTLQQPDLDLLRDLASLVEDELRWAEISTAQRGLMQELSDARRRALVDSLTHIWNRAGCEELLRREMAQAKSTGRALSIALLDLDLFKSVNDTHGHAVGDRILQSIAERLRLAARPGDSVGRYGGEEFVVLLPGCVAADAVQVAERLRARIQQEALGMPPGPYLRITVSIGVATMEPNETMADLVHRADEALYQAKRTGRDRVCAAAPSRA